MFGLLVYLFPEWLVVMVFDALAEGHRVLQTWAKACALRLTVVSDPLGYSTAPIPLAARATADGAQIKATVAATLAGVKYLRFKNGELETVRPSDTLSSEMELRLLHYYYRNPDADYETIFDNIFYCIGHTVYYKDYISSHCVRFRQEGQPEYNSWLYIVEYIDRKCVRAYWALCADTATPEMLSALCKLETKDGAAPLPNVFSLDGHVEKLWRAIEAARLEIAAH